MVMMTRWLAAGAAVAVLSVTGCSKGATITGTVVQSSQFCTDAGSFGGQAQTVEAAASAAAASGDRATLQRQTAATHDRLVKLVSEAPPDKVNGHAVRDDITTVADVYGALSAQLGVADPNGPGAVAKAWAAVQVKYGEALTKATDRLDAYTKQVCKLTVTNTVTSAAGGATTSGPQTTVAPVVTAGPTLPTSTSTP